jgi:hypothetical protein
MPIEPPAIKAPQSPVSLKFLVLIIIILLVAIAGVGYYLLKPKFIVNNTETVSNIGVPGPSLKSSFTTCNLKKDTNPLIVEFNRDEKTISGVVRGKVVSIVPQVGDQYVIHVTTDNGEMAESFPFVNTKLEITRGTQKSTLDKIKDGEVVLISFSCDPIAKGNFAISKISVITPGSL